MPFTLKILNNDLIVDFGFSFRNDEWGREFAEIQTTFNNALFQGRSYETTYVDFSKCIWVDPLPMLSLLISLNEHSRRGKASFVILPDVTHTPAETDKVVKFLHEEGFLNRFSECSSIMTASRKAIYFKNKWFDEVIDTYAQLRTPLYYTNSSMMPATILDTKDLFKDDLASVDKWVDKQVKIIQAKLRDDIPSFSQRSILHRLTIILVEMISNIVKHAYDKSDQTFAGIYIRLRNGLDNSSLSVEERAKLNRALREEEKACPRLLREFLDVRKGALEIFVIDSGIGFTESLTQLITKTTKYPFRNAYNLVFEHYQRSPTRKVPNRTSRGGLYYIGQLLNSNQDYLCGRDYNEWVGGLLPLNTDSYSLISADREKNVKGLSWIIRLSWKNLTETGKHKWQNWQGRFNENPVYKAFSESTLDLDPKYFRVIDKRFSTTSDSDSPEIFENEDIVLLLTNKNQTKFGIWKLIENSALKFPRLEQRTLIVADIPDYEKQVFIYALEGIEIYQKDHWLFKYDKVILVTKKLSVAILVRDGNTYKIADDLIDSFLYSHVGQNFQPDKSLTHLMLWIRSHDSLLFWQNVRKKNKLANYYINAEVKWSDSLKHITGYLDFAQTCTDAFCMRIYKLSLERALGLLGLPLDGENIEKSKQEIHYRIVNLDDLTKRLVDECNASFFDELKSIKESYKLFIGSVFLTGLGSVDTRVHTNSGHEGARADFHFFVHQSSTAGVPHLLNWADKSKHLQEFDKVETRFRRVGNTHVIAEHGYKSFPIPRFDKQNRSVYFRSPRETYYDWQDEKNPVISIGHFEFEGKHDLFKINIFKLIEESFLHKQDLAGFLIAEFYFALGGTVESLKDKDQISKFGPHISANFEKLKENSLSYQPVDVIVYPNNSNAAFVVEKLKEILPDELSRRIFALVPVNRNRAGSSLLISPLIIDSIKSIISLPGALKKVMLFDCTIISGRTRKELKHLMQGLGVDEVRTLSITDRFRLPFYVADQFRNKSYWRLDVPRLGSTDVCPICKASGILKSFRQDLASGLAVKRIDEILESWNVISYFDPISDHGLKPSPIFPVMEKKFGIEYDASLKNFKQIISSEEAAADKRNEIQLKNSLGLTLYATELHAMTSRDDLALKLIQKTPNLTAAAKIELLCSQLLLFPGEYSKRVQFEMIKELFIVCNELEQTDNWTGLTALVLLLQSETLHRKLLQSIKEDGWRDLKINNLDLNIVIAYVVKHEPSADVSWSENIFRLLKFKNEEKIFVTCQHFHHEIFNDAGILHAKPLIALYEKVEFSEWERLVDGINSISKLKYLIDNIPIWNFRRLSNWAVYSHAYKEACQEMLTHFYKRFESLIETQKKILDQVDKDWLENFDNLKLDVRDRLLPELKKVHRLLFCSVLPAQSVPDLKEEINEIIKSIALNDWVADATKKQIELGSRIPQVIVSKSAGYYFAGLPNKKKDYWVVFDQQIESELRFTMMNALYAIGKIKDIWSRNGSDTTVADMWVNIQMKDDAVEIMFANLSKNTAEQVESDIRLKRKEGVMHLLEDLNGSFWVEQHSTTDEGNIIIVKLKLQII